MRGVSFMMPTRFWNMKNGGEFLQQSPRFLSTAAGLPSPTLLCGRLRLGGIAACTPVVSLSLPCLYVFTSHVDLIVLTLHAPALLVLHVYIGPIARFSVFLFDSTCTLSFLHRTHISFHLLSCTLYFSPFSTWLRSTLRRRFRTLSLPFDRLEPPFRLDLHVCHLCSFRC